MNNQLFIPDRINVGLQGRGDTYTGKLAYVIYWDKKGVLRKQTSWDGWRWKEGDKRSEWEGGKRVDVICGPEYAPQAYDNVPTEGFVLNKGVGGQRHSYGWNARNEYIRVYDPRGFEFEISVANLLFILQETSSISGKGLEGEFVYSWEGKELVLLPVVSQEYKNSANFSDLQNKKVTKGDVIPGCLYKTKQQVDVMYLGKFNWIEIGRYYNKTIDMYQAHIFYNVKDGTFYPEKGFTKLAERLTNDVAENYSDILEFFQKSKNFSKITSFMTKPFVLNETELMGDSYYKSTMSYLFQGNQIYEVTIQSDYNWNGNERKFNGFKINKDYRINIKDNMINYTSTYDYSRSRSDKDTKIYSFSELKDLNFIDLYLILESGIEIKINDFFQ